MTKVVQQVEMGFRISASLTLPVETSRRVFSFLAMRGAGKTYCASVLAEEMLKVGVPIIIIDPMGIFWGLQVGRDGKGKGYPIVVFGGEHQNLALEPDKAENIARAIVASNISCVLDVSDLSHAQVQRLIPLFLDELRRINTNDRHVFIEEADVIAPQKPQRNETVCLGAVSNFVRRGGNRNLGCTLISQRSAVVNKNVLTQSDFLVVLRTNAPQDKEAVAAWAVRRSGDKKKLNAWLDSLSDLDDGEAYIWGPDMNIPGLRIKFRERETFHATRENLKRYDPSKIRPMDVGEFIAKYRHALEGKKIVEQPKQEKIIELKPLFDVPLQKDEKIVKHDTKISATTYRHEHRVLKEEEGEKAVIHQSLPNVELQQFKPTFSLPVEILNEPATALGKVLVVLKNDALAGGRQDKWTENRIKEHVRRHAWDDTGVDEAIDQLIRWEILMRNAAGYMRFYAARVQIVESQPMIEAS